MKRIVLRALPLLVAVLTLFATASVRAQQSNGLGVSPRKDYNIQPGQTANDSLYISNLSLRQDLLVNVRLIDFSAQNETGAPALHIGQNDPQTPWSLKPFIKVQDSVRVGAGKSANVPFSITIPAGQGAGSYYSAVEYTAQNPETKEKVNIAASTVSLIFVTVPGEADERLDLKQFGAYASNDEGVTGRFQSAFFAAAPKELAYRLENQGKVAERPSGSMVIKDVFGRTVKEIGDANPKKQLALIGQTRRIQVCIMSSILESKAPSGQTEKQTVCDNPGLLPGRYTARMALYYGLNGASTKEVQAVASFWYLPWWSLLALCVTLLFLTALVWLIRRAFRPQHRRYHR